jgi:PmbA protein
MEKRVFLMADKKNEAAVETLAGLLKGRADAYEIFYSSSEGLSIEAKDGAVDAFKVRSGRGVGVRTISGGRLGFGYSTVLTGDALSGMIEGALAGSLEVAEDEFLAFPAPAPTSVAGCDPDSLGVYDRDFSSASEDDKIDLAMRIEKSALAGDKRVRRVRKASYGETVATTRVVNSAGVDADFRATYFTASVTAVAEESGASEMGWEMGLSHARRDIDPESIGKGAATRAASMLGARKIKTVRCPAVIENIVVCELLEALSSSFLADNVAKGKSMLANRVGEAVASPALNVSDDGNAARGSYKGLPSVGISNLYIEAGAKTPDELFGEMGSGLFITEAMGIHMINMVSGDFSIGASGFHVEDGAPAYPVKGMAISGNLLDLFSKVAECGSDIRFIGSIGAPSLLVSEVEASGS